MLLSRRHGEQLPTAVKKLIMAPEASKGTHKNVAKPNPEMASTTNRSRRWGLPFAGLAVKFEGGSNYSHRVV